jgi:hypothetical protein
MYHGQFFGKTVHEIWTIEKNIICPWTVAVHGQLSMKRTRPQKTTVNLSF